MLATRSAAQRPTEPICVRSGVLVNGGPWISNATAVVSVDGGSLIVADLEPLIIPEMIATMRRAYSN